MPLGGSMVHLGERESLFERERERERENERVVAHNRQRCRQSGEHSESCLRPWPRDSRRSHRVLRDSVRIGVSPSVMLQESITRNCSPTHPPLARTVGDRSCTDLRHAYCARPRRSSLQSLTACSTCPGGAHAVDEGQRARLQRQRPHERPSERCCDCRKTVWQVPT